MEPQGEKRPAGRLITRKHGQVADTASGSPAPAPPAPADGIEGLEDFDPGAFDAGVPTISTRKPDSSHFTTGDDTLMHAIPPGGSETLVRQRAPVPALPPKLPATIGPYRVVSEIARGGMGVVLRAHHPGLDRTVAIKTLHPGVSEDASGRARFLVEARAAARLSRHPGIVQVHDVGTDLDGNDYLVMDFVEGESLRSKIVREGRLEPRAGAAFVEKVARAIAHAHAQGVLHRDLKPHNVLVDRATGEPLLTDFGLAKLVSAAEEKSSGTSRRRVSATSVAATAPSSTSELTLAGEIMGSPPYMAPEQIEPGLHGPVGPHTDIWGLGALLHECLMGQPPFPGASPFESFEKILTQPTRALNGVPPALEAIVHRCLQKSPHARYRTADEVARELSRYLAGAPVLGQVHVRRVAERAVAPGRLLVLLAAVGGAAWLGATRLHPALKGDGALPVATTEEPPTTAPTPPAVIPETPLELPTTLDPVAAPPRTGVRLAGESIHKGNVARLAEEGCVDAMLIYGHALLGDTLGPPDPARGVEWLERAAHAGYPRAALVLARVLRRGQSGAPADPERAIRALRRSAEDGAVDCMLPLAELHLDLEQDRDAARWLEAAHAAGVPDARLRLAELLSGEGPASDPRRAVQLWTEAAAAGSLVAMVELAIAHKEGRGVARDPAKALEWFHRAAEGGSADAMFALGAAYELGLLGVAESELDARRWYERARDAGSPEAEERLATLGR